MSICINCGKENGSYLCIDCRAKVDIESLCRKIIGYRQDSNENELWEKLMSEMKNPYNFKHIAFAVSDELPSPRKEYMKVMSLTGESSNIDNGSHQWLYEIYDAVKDADGLSVAEKLRLGGIVLGALYNDHEYEAADALAAQLSAANDAPWQVCYNLADFYTKTRRYDIAEDIISKAKTRFAGNDYVIDKMNNPAKENAKYVKKANEGKQEYMPRPKESREKYLDFLTSIGMEVKKPSPAKRAKGVIPRDEYPDPVEARDSGFDTFVAFDLETTGTNTNYDSIVEIGAVKVVGGKVVDSEEFTFQELVRPLDNKKISPEAQAKNGLTDEEVNGARPVWEVFPDFMKFVDDSVLLGFNCMSFDSKFMVRAGRYSNLIVENKYFDVMHYAAQFSEKLGLGKKFSLEDLSEKLNVKNPRAHRALADALTTARIFTELKKLYGGNEVSSVEDMLSDLDEW